MLMGGLLMINIYTHSTYIDSKDLLVCVHPEKKTPPHTDIPKKKMIKRRDKMPPLKYNWDDTVERFFKKKNLYQ